MNNLGNDSLSVALVAEHASIDFGGEAALPCHYFRELLKLNIDVYLIVHERSRTFLQNHFPNEQDRIRFVEDSFLHRSVYRLQRPLPHRLGIFTFGILLRQLTQRKQKQILRQLIEEKKVNLVHQIIPVSPKDPSSIFGLGVPVVMGPMNGGMTFPPAFASYDGAIVQALTKLGRKFSRIMQWLIPGKLRADILLVANQRTRTALPLGTKGEIIELVENGIDTDVWFAESELVRQSTECPQFLFVGRLVDWKAVDILLDAFGEATRNRKIKLRIIGEGVERKALEAKAEQVCRQGMGEIQFDGWLTQHEIAKVLQQTRALVLPSLYECGGAVVLEAMACSCPVIATNWGGPADYLDETCGILVNPGSREELVDGISTALCQLVDDENVYQALSRRALSKSRQFRWDNKVQKILQVYRLAVSSHRHNFA